MTSPLFSPSSSASTLQREKHAYPTLPFAAFSSPLGHAEAPGAGSSKHLANDQPQSPPQAADSAVQPHVPTPRQSFLDTASSHNTSGELTLDCSRPLGRDNPWDSPRCRSCGQRGG